MREKKSQEKRINLKPFNALYIYMHYVLEKTRRRRLTHCWVPNFPFSSPWLWRHFIGRVRRVRIMQLSRYCFLNWIVCAPKLTQVHVSSVALAASRHLTQKWNTPLSTRYLWHFVYIFIFAQRSATIRPHRHHSYAFCLWLCTFRR